MNQLQKKLQLEANKQYCKSERNNIFSVSSNQYEKDSSEETENNHSITFRNTNDINDKTESNFSQIDTQNENEITSNKAHPLANNPSQLFPVNIFNCSKHPNKKVQFIFIFIIKAKYSIPDGKDQIYFCSKCAIHYAVQQKGIPLQRLDNINSKIIYFSSMPTSSQRKQQVADFLQEINNFKKQISSLLPIFNDQLITIQNNSQGLIDQVNFQYIKLLRTIENQKNQIIITEQRKSEEETILIKELESELAAHNATLISMLKDLEDNIDPILNEIEIEPFNNILCSYLKKLEQIVSFISKAMEIHLQQRRLKPNIIQFDFTSIDQTQIQLCDKDQKFLTDYKQFMQKYDIALSTNQKEEIDNKRTNSQFAMINPQINGDPIRSTTDRQNAQFKESKEPEVNKKIIQNVARIQQFTQQRHQGKESGAQNKQRQHKPFQKLLFTGNFQSPQNQLSKTKFISDQYSQQKANMRNMNITAYSLSTNSDYLIQSPKPQLKTNKTNNNNGKYLNNLSNQSHLSRQSNAQNVSPPTKQSQKCKQLENSVYNYIITNLHQNVCSQSINHQIQQQQSQNLSYPLSPLSLNSPNLHNNTNINSQVRNQIKLLSHKGSRCENQKKLSIQQTKIHNNI